MILSLFFAVVACVIGEGAIYGIKYHIENIGPLLVLGFAFSLALGGTILSAKPCMDKPGIFICG